MNKWIAGVALALVAFGWFSARGVLRGQLDGPSGTRSGVVRLETPPASPATDLAAVVRSEREEAEKAAAPELQRGGLELHLTWADGAPAAGMEVDVLSSSDPAPREERVRSRCDASGVAAVEDLFAGQAQVFAVGRAFGEGERLLEVEVPAGATRVVHASLHAGVDVRGSVVDARGAPVAGAELWSGPASSRVPGLRLLGRSASDGSFHLRGLDPLRNRLGARAEGHRPSPCFELRDLTLDPAGHRSARFELGESGGRIQGVVLDPDGRPLTGARVCGGPRGGHNLSQPSGVRASAAQPAAVLTGEDGRFILPWDLEPGVQPLYVQARGYPTWQGEVEVPVAGTASVEVRLERPSRVEGRVVDEQGQPVAGVLVRAAEEDRGGWYSYVLPVSEDTSDADGWFTLDWLASGPRELNAHDHLRPELGRARATVACSPGTTSRVELRLDSGLTISGRVVDASGQPLAGWRVRSATVGMPSWYPRRTRTDEAGRFRLRNLGDCAHDLSVHAPDFGFSLAGAEGVAPGTEDLELVVRDADPGTGQVHGFLVDEGGGVLADLALVIWEVDGEVGHFRAFEPSSGEFHLAERPGRYRLHAMRGGATLAISGSFEVREGETSEVGELRIRAQGELELVVAGLSGAELEALRPRLDRPGYSTRTPELEGGVFRVPAIAPGEWFLRAALPGIHLRPTVEVLDGGRTTVTLNAEPGLPLSVEASRADGGLLRELQLEVRAPDGELLFRDQRSYTEPQTRVRWRIALPAGPATVQVHAGEASGSGNVTVEAPGRSLALALEVP